MKLKEFKSKMLQYGGPARPNLFYVQLTRSGTKNGVGEGVVELFCKTVNMPGLNLRTFDYAPSNYGMQQQIPFGINSEPLTCTFILDSSHSVLSYLHSWVGEIINFQGKRDSKLYELSYQEEYAATMTIYFMSADNNLDRYVVQLNDVYPTNVGSLSLSWDENDSYATVPVLFSYSSIETVSEYGNRSSETYHSIVDGLNSYYFEGGRNMHSNSPVSGVPLQQFIDLKTKVNHAKNSDAYKLIKKIT